MRATAYIPVAGGCAPSVLPTRLRRSGRNFDSPGGASPLPPAMRPTTIATGHPLSSASPAAPSPKQVSRGWGFAAMRHCAIVSLCLLLT